MFSAARMLILAIAFVLAGLVGMREYGNACGPKPPGEEAQGHEHEAEEGHHSGGGILDEVCKEGLITVLREKAGIESSAAAVKPEEPAKSDKKSNNHDSADHANGADDGKHAGHDKEGEHAKHEHGKEAHGEPGSASLPAEKSEPKKKYAKESGGTDGHEHGKPEAGHGEGEESEGLVKLSAEQAAAAGITTTQVGPGALIKEIAVPGRIAINANAQAKVVPKLPGTVAKVMRQVGDTVAEGDILAKLESREMSDAKGEYLAAVRSEELAKSTANREERLWKQKVTAEQDLLMARNAHQEAVIKRDLAHQKLHTIGLSEEEIAALPKSSDEATYRFYELRAPIAGKVISREIVMGQIVGTDREAFSLADLATVWIEMSVAPADLSFAKEGQEVRVQSSGKPASAKVISVNPAIDPETRAAKVIAEIDNRNGEWRLGDFVNAQLLSGKQEVPVLAPRDAIQTVKGAQTVFVSEDGGFRMRTVTTGREDSGNVEILSGLKAGETIASKNSFTLKAELGKAEAEHEH